jgi:hypothetical protein
MSQLVERLGALLTCRTSGHHQDPDLFDGTVPGFRGYRRLPRESGSIRKIQTSSLDAGPYTYVWADALTMKVREGGRIVSVACLVATGVNGGGHQRSSVLILPHLKTRPAGWGSSAPWSPEASQGCSWSSQMTTPA